VDEAEFRTRLRLLEEQDAPPEEIIALARQHLDSRRKEPDWLSNVLFAGGLLAAALAFGGKVAEDVWFGDEAEICKEAHEAMRDDQLNREVPARDRAAYLEKQAQNAIWCAQRKLD
jgi:hypothetical protein